MPNDPDSPPRSSEWDTPSEPEPGSPARRAALLVWFLGGLEVVASVFAATGFHAMRLMPPEDLTAQLQRSGNSAEQIAQMRNLLLPAEITVLLLGLLPGLAYVALGFGVRRGRGVAIDLALLLAATQGIVLGALLLGALVLAVMQRQPSQLTAAALLLGTPLACLIACCLSLWRARRARAAAAEQAREPWERRGE